MGPLGTQELVFIFILALLLFGPKKLPELGKTIGKAMTEFRRAQTELKTTFDREMKNLERETGMQELTATTYQSGSYDYDHSAYDPSYYEDGTHNSSASGSYNSTVTLPPTHGASAIQGAESTAGLQLEAAAGSIASGHLDTSSPSGAGAVPEHAAAGPAEHGAAPAHGADPVQNTDHS
jgi:sec-independent protein translocase protein TatA